MHSILLIITGSIAAYKSLDLIRRLRERDYEVRAILTKGGQEFITPLSVASLTGTGVYTDLFSLKDEVEMGHIRLARQADLILIAPASADMLAKMVQGRADDLATATILAADKPVMVAPAMNTKMWEHAATQRNIIQLKKDGIHFIAPGEGMLACGEKGQGRMAEVDGIIAVVEKILKRSLPLAGMKALVTSGPTHEPIDPVRFIGNRSSGKQGHAIAATMAHAGADVTLISGPVLLPDPKNMRVIHVETAEEMLAASLRALPADIAVCAAAVADWRTTPSTRKIKKHGKTPELKLEETTDILATLAQHKKRPRLLIGFAAETDHMEKQAREKRARKGADWLLANDVSQGQVFGKDDNMIYFITARGAEKWPRMRKREVAEKLVTLIAEEFIPNQRKPRVVK